MYAAVWFETVVAPSSESLREILPTTHNSMALRPVSDLLASKKRILTKNLIYLSSIVSS
jgi:hypothetical protein